MNEPRHDSRRISSEAGLLGGGCCTGHDSEKMDATGPLSRGGRRARALAGVGFLAIAGILGPRQLPGRIALWPAALVPTWFGISHLVAGVTGYQGCPELGCDPSVMLGRTVASSCAHWRRIDRHISRHLG